jgi:hypothetical protein
MVGRCETIARSFEPEMMGLRIRVLRKRGSVMTLQRTIICIASVFIAVGFVTSQAGAGGDPPECTNSEGNLMEIEVNALRGGSPTVTAGPGSTRDITAKARITKESAPPGTTIETTLQIEVIDGSEVLQVQTKSPIRLVVGKGGRGAKLPMSIPQCNSGFISFVATFFGNDGNGPCEGTKFLRKQCN